MNAPTPPTGSVSSNIFSSSPPSHPCLPTTCISMCWAEDLFLPSGSTTGGGRLGPVPPHSPCHGIVVWGVCAGFLSQETLYLPSPYLPSAYPQFPTATHGGDTPTPPACFLQVGIVVVTGGGAVPGPKIVIYLVPHPLAPACPTLPTTYLPPLPPYCFGDAWVCWRPSCCCGCTCSYHLLPHLPSGRRRDWRAHLSLTVRPHILPTLPQ